MMKPFLLLLILSLSFTTWAAPKFKDLAIGYGYACAHDGSNISCWGKNLYNQAISVEGLSNIRKIKVHEKYACALDDAGLICWGQAPVLTLQMYTSEVTDFDLVEDGVCAVVSGKVDCTKTDILEKMPVGLNNVSSIVFTEDYDAYYALGLCVTQNGRAICWQKNGRIIETSQPKDFYAVKVNRGYQGGCLLSSDSRLSCWLNPNESSPVAELPKNPGIIVDFYGDSSSGCLNNILGELKCWGYIFQAPSNFHVARMAHGRPVSGMVTTCLLDSNGKVFCHGGEAILSNTPIDAKDALSWKVGENSVCFGFTSELLCTGDSLYKKTAISGLKTFTVDRNTLFYQDNSGPKLLSEFKQLAIPTDIKSVSEISISDMTSPCVLTDEGGVRCWGTDWDDEPSPTTRDAPIDLKGATKLTSGRSFACVLTSINQAVCWGKTPGPTSIDHVIDVQAGYRHFCALLKNDTLNCYGLTDAPPSHQLDIKGVISGTDFSCSYTDTDVSCWGSNTNTQILSPPKVVGKIKKISTYALADHACFEDDEKIKCWGQNFNGEFNFFQ